MRDVFIQTPRGSYDFLPEAAAFKRKIEEKLAALFSQWGYGEIITPTFEFYDSLERGDGPELAKQMYRFFDPEGNMLALRPDLTTPIARVVATRFRSEPKPLRFYYLSNVFRYGNIQQACRREFYQAGVELVGNPGPEADAEVINLAVKALETVGLQSFRLDIGQLGFYHGLMEDAGLTPQVQKAIKTALLRRDYVLLEEVLSAAHQLSERTRKALRALPDLRGGLEVLDQARELADSPRSREALANLRQILAVLESQGVSDRVYVDLGMIKDIDYYTGMVMEGYCSDLGYTICTGGRYDNLIGQFGYPCPATGFALGIERLMLALGDGQASSRPGQTGDKQLLTVALPKGRLFEPVRQLLCRAGISSEALTESRKLIIEDEKEGLRFLLAKPKDIPTYVEYGAADLGIVGKDTLVESGKDVAELLDLGLGRCRMVVAVSEESGIEDVRELDFNSRVATSYPSMARSYFAEHGIQAEVVELRGSIELGPIIGLADAIVDITETGTTLRANGLVPIAEVMEISARLIVNRVSQKTKHEQVRDVFTKLQEACKQDV